MIIATWNINSIRLRIESVLDFVKEKRLYLNGKLEGEYYYYYSSGKLWIKNNYKKGLLHGERKVYYESGKLEKKEDFKNGFNLSGTYH